MHFLHVRFCSVSVRETELRLTCSVLFWQNGKTHASVGHYNKVAKDASLVMKVGVCPTDLFP